MFSVNLSVCSAKKEHILASCGRRLVVGEGKPQKQNGRCVHEALSSYSLMHTYCPLARLPLLTTSSLRAEPGARAMQLRRLQLDMHAAVSRKGALACCIDSLSCRIDVYRMLDRPSLPHTHRLEIGALGNKTVALALASLNPTPESVHHAAVTALSSSNLKQGGNLEELRETTLQMSHSLLERV